MVQVLKVTEPNSTRPKLPHEFTNSFDITLNNAKAFAYSYDIKKLDGTPVFVPESDNPISEPDGELVDARLHGELQNPDLSHHKHIFALLATGILIAEQMILEQLLRDACVFGDKHPNAKALQAILNDENIYQKLKALAQDLPGNDQGPILGLQIKECEPLIELLRKSLGFNDLIFWIFRNNNNDLNEDALLNLFNVGKILQNLQPLSVVKEGSRGINAGIAPVIKVLSPSLYNQLANNGEIAEFNQWKLKNMEKQNRVMRQNILLMQKMKNNRASVYVPILEVYQVHMLQKINSRLLTQHNKTLGVIFLPGK